MQTLAFDDGPFVRSHRGSVLLVGVVASGTRADAILSGSIRRDGADATRQMIALAKRARVSSLSAVLVQGIAVGGFNVIDVHALSEGTGAPVIVVVRKPPNLAAVKRALFSVDPPGRPRVRGADRKWRLVEAAGPVEAIALGSARAQRRLEPGPDGTLYVQVSGISVYDARTVIRSTLLHGNIPEPLRLAHLIAGGIVTGRSRGRA